MSGFEWSMGNGQCPSCYGLGPVFCNPLDFRKNSVGHELDCELAALIVKAGDEPMMKSAKE